jgi:hypothetical protein
MHNGINGFSKAGETSTAAMGTAKIGLSNALQRGAKGLGTAGNAMRRGFSKAGETSTAAMGTAKIGLSNALQRGTKGLGTAGNAMRRGFSKAGETSRAALRGIRRALLPGSRMKTRVHPVQQQGLTSLPSDSKSCRWWYSSTSGHDGIKRLLEASISWKTEDSVILFGEQMWLDPVEPLPGTYLSQNTIRCILTVIRPKDKLVLQNLAGNVSFPTADVDAAAAADIVSTCKTVLGDVVAKAPDCVCGLLICRDRKGDVQVDAYVPEIGHQNAEDPAPPVSVFSEPDSVSYMVPEELGQPSHHIAPHTPLFHEKSKSGGGLWRRQPPPPAASSNPDAKHFSAIVYCLQEKDGVYTLMLPVSTNWGEMAAKAFTFCSSVSPTSPIDSAATPVASSPPPRESSGNPRSIPASGYHTSPEYGMSLSQSLDEHQTPSPPSSTNEDPAEPYLTSSSERSSRGSEFGVDEKRNLRQPPPQPNSDGSGDGSQTLPRASSEHSAPQQPASHRVNSIPGFFSRKKPQNKYWTLTKITDPRDASKPPQQEGWIAAAFRQRRPGAPAP